MRVHAFCADDTRASVIIYERKHGDMLDNFLWDVCNRHHKFGLAVQDLLLTSVNVGAPVISEEIQKMSLEEEEKGENERDAQWAQFMKHFPQAAVGPNGHRHIAFLLSTYPNHLLFFKTTACENLKEKSLNDLWTNFLRTSALTQEMTGTANMDSFMAVVAVMNVMLNMVHELILFCMDVFVQGTRSEQVLVDMFYDDARLLYYMHNVNQYHFLDKNMSLILKYTTTHKADSKRLFMLINSFPWPSALTEQAETILESVNEFVESQPTVNQTKHQGLNTKDLHDACQHFALELFEHLFVEFNTEPNAAKANAEFLSKKSRTKMNILRTLANASTLRDKFMVYIQKNTLSLNKNEMRMKVLREKSKLMNIKVEYAPSTNHGQKTMNIMEMLSNNEHSNVFDEIIKQIESNPEPKKSAVVNLHDWILPQNWRQHLNTDIDVSKALGRLISQVESCTRLYKEYAGRKYSYDNMVQLDPHNGLQVRQDPEAVFTGCIHKDSSWYAKHCKIYNLQENEADHVYDHLYCSAHDVYTLAKEQERHLNDMKIKLLKSSIGLLQLCKYRHMKSIIAQSDDFDPQEVDHILLDSVLHMLAHAQVLMIAKKCAKHIEKVMSIQKTMQETLWSMKSNTDQYKKLENIDPVRAISEQKTNTCKTFSQWFELQDDNLPLTAMDAGTTNVRTVFKLLIEKTLENQRPY